MIKLQKKFSFPPHLPPPLYPSVPLHAFILHSICSSDESFRTCHTVGSLCHALGPQDTVLKKRILLHPITPLWHFLTNSGPVLSYCHTIHAELHHTHENFVMPIWTPSCPHDLCHTHANFVTPTWTSSLPHEPCHTHTHMTIGPYPHSTAHNITSHILFSWPDNCHLSICPHIYFYAPTLTLCFYIM